MLLSAMIVLRKQQKLIATIHGAFEYIKKYLGYHPTTTAQTYPFRNEAKFHPKITTLIQRKEIIHSQEIPFLLPNDLNLNLYKTPQVNPLRTKLEKWLLH